MKSLFKPLAIFLSANILLVQVSAAVPQTKSGKINVGYIGEKLDDIPDGYKKLVRQKMLGLINQNYYEFHNPTDLSAIHSNVIATILSHNKNSFNGDLALLSKDANLDYIFVTSLNNISEDQNRVMLEGNVFRYNRKSDDVYRYEILSYAEDLDLHIQAIKRELVETIPHSVYGLGRNRIYVLVGIAIIVGFAMSQTFGNMFKFLQDDNKNEEPIPPVGD